MRARVCGGIGNVCETFSEWIWKGILLDSPYLKLYKRAVDFEFLPDKICSWKYGNRNNQVLELQWDYVRVTVMLFYLNKGRIQTVHKDEAGTVFGTQKVTCQDSNPRPF